MTRENEFTVIGGTLAFFTIVGPVLCFVCWSLAPSNVLLVSKWTFFSLLFLWFVILFDWPRSYRETLNQLSRWSRRFSKINGQRDCVAAVNAYWQEHQELNDIWGFVAALEVQSRGDRRTAIREYGYEKFVKEVKAEPIRQDEFGWLYRIELWDDEPLTVIEVEDPKTKKRYFHRVPPNMRRTKQAVAWMWERTEKTYNPILHT